MNQENSSSVPLHPEQLPDIPNHPPFADGLQLYQDIKVGVGSQVRTTHFSLHNKQTGCHGVHTHTQVGRSDGSVFHRRGYLFIHGDSCACLVPGQPTHYADKAPEHLEAHAAALLVAGKVCEKGCGVLVMQLFLGLPVAENFGLPRRVTHVPEQVIKDGEDEKKMGSVGSIKIEKEGEDDTTGDREEHKKKNTWLRLL
jgi:hypothetical protein